MEAFDDRAGAAVRGHARPDITEENIQSRARGLMLMAISNKFGHMLLTTGNKSEMSVGYATLYGDMCGGYSVLKDVYKTAVFALSPLAQRAPSAAARWGRTGRSCRSASSPNRRSAELKHDQTDQDTSAALRGAGRASWQGLIEGERSVDAMVDMGFERETVLRVWQMLDRAEYKRRQAPPGVKITAARVRARPALPHHQRVHGAGVRERPVRPDGRLAGAHPRSCPAAPRTTSPRKSAASRP